MKQEGKRTNLSAADIVQLLSVRHSKDVFVPECKDGPTWGSRHLRLDAVAIKRSWTNPRIIGYEIKVSRADFLSDKKWTRYLPFCNQFYFVTTWNLIDKKELPEGVGLIYANPSGSRLYTKRRAPFRQIEEPATMFRYILYSRARIVSSSDMYYSDRDPLEYWKTWLNIKEQRIAIGAQVSEKIKREHQGLISETYRQKRQIEQLEAELERRDNGDEG